MKKVLIQTLLILLVVSCQSSKELSSISVVNSTDFVKDIKIGYEKYTTGIKPYLVKVSINRKTFPIDNSGLFTSPPYIVGTNKHTCYFDESLKTRGDIYIYIKNVDSLDTRNTKFELEILKHFNGKVRTQTIGPLEFDLGTNHRNKT